jgi:hypothetical protein
MITVTKICFLIPQETVLLERERSPGTMSEDDLLWCFGGNVDFVDAESQQSRVAIDVPLLGFAGDLAMLAGQLRTDGNYEVPDRYGGYVLTFIAKGGHVSVHSEGNVGVKNAPPKAGPVFVSEAGQLFSAMGNFAYSVMGELLALFPELGANLEFHRLCNDIRGRFLSNPSA